jgi:putative addiction module killer protein
MIEVRETSAFSAWLRGLADRRARIKVQLRIDRMKLGNFGDAAAVGTGVSELRIHYGPGYRVYFIRRGEKIVVLLGGGDKSTQSRDIEVAKILAADLED